MPLEPFQLEAGDSFRTVCSFRDGSSFGPSSQQEMCVAYMMYYPAKTLLGVAPWLCARNLPVLEMCQEDTTNRTLANEAELGRQFGTSQKDQCGKSLAPSFGSRDTILSTVMALATVWCLSSLY